MARKKVSIKKVVELLNSGYTRYEKENIEKEGIGSVQQELGLTFTECKLVFANEFVKGIRVIIPTIEIVNDYTPPEETIEIVNDVDSDEVRLENVMATVEAEEAAIFN